MDYRERQLVSEGYVAVVRVEDIDGNVSYAAVDTSDLVSGSIDEVQVLDGSIPNGFVFTGEFVTVRRLLTPLEPSVAVGIGSNYKQAFVGGDKPLPSNPVLFFKTPNSFSHPGDPVILPRKAILAEKVKFEGELCVILRKGGKNIPRERAMDHVFGYTIANDFSAVDWQGERVGNQWSKGKNFDTFCPLGPGIVTVEDIVDPGELRITTTVNDHVAQAGNVSDMLFPIDELIEFASAGCTLPSGCAILTGTPPGAFFVNPGDQIDVSISGIGTLSCDIVQEA